MTPDLMESMREVRERTSITRSSTSGSGPSPPARVRFLFW